MIEYVIIFNRCFFYSGQINILKRSNYMSVTLKSKS